MLPDWLFDYLVQLVDCPSWQGPISEFAKSRKDGFESANLARLHREFSNLIDGLLAAHLLDIEISDEVFSSIAEEIAVSNDPSLVPLKKTLFAAEDLEQFQILISELFSTVPSESRRSNLTQRVDNELGSESPHSLITSVALDPLAHAPNANSPKAEGLAPHRIASQIELRTIPEGSMMVDKNLRLSAANKISAEELARRLERLKVLKAGLKTSPESRKVTSESAPKIEEDPSNSLARSLLSEFNQSK